MFSRKLWSLLHFAAACQVDHSFPVLATVNISKWFKNHLFLSFKCLPCSIALVKVTFGAVGAGDIYYSDLNV